MATLGTLVIYLLGLVGSILIWLSRRAGVWPSLVHQILIVPVFFIPGAFYRVIGDGFAVAALICAVYLNRLSRAGVSSKTTADEPSRTGAAGAPLTLTRKTPL